MIRLRASQLLPLIGLLALSCATSSELAKRSEQALEAHDYERAYHEARASLAKDHHNGRARMALSAAASHLIDQREQRIMNLAATDTVGAADACLALESFRAEAMAAGATLPEHPDFATDANRLRLAAAGIMYRSSSASLEQNQPKQAYRELLSVRQYRPGYRDIDTRIPKVFQQAVTRVALLPFDDQTGVPDLSRSIAARMYAELSKGVHSKGFEFTELVPQEKVLGELRVSQLGTLTREEAIELGRKLGAAQVIYGHFGSLRSHSDNDRYHGTIWRKFTEKDSSGKSHDRYVDVPFDAVQRRREVELTMAYEVIDVDTEEGLAKDSRDLDAVARTVYTDYMPEGDCGKYCLVPPDIKRDSDRAERIEEEWKNTFHAWTVPSLLERARHNHDHTRWRSEYRGDFLDLDADRPVFLDDIPPAPELVRIALDDSWKRVLGTLRDLDPKD